MRLVLAAGLALLQPTGAWISTAQARYGATLEEIVKATRSTSDAPPLESLGWLWSAPHGLVSTRGLGGSITWAWDPELCDKLLPRFSEDFWAISFINCGSIKAALHRAFDTWAQNHPAISFTEVTKLCEHTGTLVPGINGGCIHAEVWVTHRAASGGEQAAVWIPTYEVRTDFKFTNGNTLHFLGSGAYAGLQVPKQVVETTGGRIEFSRQVCWYLDSDFCSAFHRLKKFGGGPQAVHATGAALLFGLWGVAALFIILDFLLAFRKQFRTRARLLVDRDGDGTITTAEVAVQAYENVSLRLQALLAAIASESIVGTMFRFIVFMLPWPFYVAVFRTCWDCFDFEAAAAHEIGHLLGLSHPDKLPGAECATPECDAAAPSSSYYSALLAGGVNWMNSSYCATPWDYVVPGVPPDFPTADLVGEASVRPSLMESLTTHNPSVCLSQDDYEGLLTLYPTCAGAPPAPICEKSQRNIGLLRVTMFVVGPLLLAILISIVIHCAVDRQRKRWQQMQGLGGTRKVSPFGASTSMTSFSLGKVLTTPKQVQPTASSTNRQAPPPSAPMMEPVQEMDESAEGGSSMLMETLMETPR